MESDSNCQFESSYCFSKNQSIGFEDVLILTTDILKFAEEKEIINSYSEIMSQLAELMLYPPEE